KYAFLQMSDPGGVFECMMFADELARARPFLEPGVSLLMVVEADMRDDQMRIAVQSCSKLEDAIAGQARTCKVTMQNTQGLKDIKAILAAEGNGASNIVLIVPVKPGVQAEMVLPGRYRLSQSAISALHRVPGVQHVAEG
ncbi:MAG TPA: hypothetical protein VIN59_08030, partial [Alphaproteobacteria bacterium]